MTEAEADVLAVYSTPGLRKGEMTREAKRDHLAGLKVERAERDKIIAAMYGHTDSELHVIERAPLQRFVTVTCPRDGNTVAIKPIIEVR